MKYSLGTVLTFGYQKPEPDCFILECEARVNSAFAIDELMKSMFDVCDVCVKFIEKLRTKFNIY